MNYITKGEYLRNKKETAADSLTYVTQKLNDTIEKISEAKTADQKKKILDDLTQAALMIAESRAVLADSFNENMPAAFDLDDFDLTPYTGAQYQFEEKAEVLANMIRN